MATVKRSVTLDADLLAEAEELIGERGLSALLNEGLRRAVLVERGREAVAAFEAESGPAPEHIERWIDEQWPESASTPAS